MRALLLVLFLSLNSCAHLTVNRNDSPDSSGDRTEIKLASFLFGFVPGKKMPPAAALCPKGRFESVNLEMKGTDVWMTAITLGIYVPHRAIVICGK